MKPTADQRRAKSKPPPADDPTLMRTCNRCNAVRQWIVAYCPLCGSPEFRLDGNPVSIAKRKALGVDTFGRKLLPEFARVRENATVKQAMLF